MTNTIGSLSSSHAATEAASQGAANAANKPAAAPETPAPQGNAAQAGEAVTLSATAQSSALLLDAARNADGVDQARVAQLRSALQGGSYDVSPEDLAKAIAGASIGQSAFGAPGNGTS